MAILNLAVADQFSDSESVTSTELNNLTLNASFVTGATGATDDARCTINSDGRITVKEGGIRKNEVDFINSSTAELELLGTAPKIIFRDEGNSSGAKDKAPRIDCNNADGDMMISTHKSNAHLEIKTANNGGSPTSRFIVGQTVSKNTNNQNTAGVRVTGCIYSTQSISADGDVVADLDSDERLKDNIEPIKEPLEKLKTLSGNTFTWNDKTEKVGTSDIGVIAQEVEKIMPMAIRSKENGYLKVHYSKIIPLLIESIKELSEKVEKLESMAHTHGIK